LNHQAYVVLQAENHLLAQGELISEGEIIRSSVCCEFGGACISHAAGAGGGGHDGYGAGGADWQPLMAIVNSAAQSKVFVLFIVQFPGALLVNQVTSREHFAADARSLTQAVTLAHGAVAITDRLVALIHDPIERGPDQKADQQGAK
jgi:hypothetical protein